MDKFEDLVPEERAQRATRRTIPASMLREARVGFSAVLLIAIGLYLVAAATLR
jgi:hypothetical protein